MILHVIFVFKIISSFFIFSDTQVGLVFWIEKSDLLVEFYFAPHKFAFVHSLISTLFVDDR